MVYEITDYLSNITFIFDRCWRSLAAVTPDKYVRDWNNRPDRFAKLKFSITEKWDNGALLTPTYGTIEPQENKITTEIIQRAHILLSELFGSQGLEESRL